MACLRRQRASNAQRTAPLCRRGPGVAGSPFSQYDYSNHRQTLYDIEEQVGLTDKLENGISAERNRTWYISYKQQVRRCGPLPAHAPSRARR